MKQFKIIILALCCLVGGSAWGQTDVTSTYLVNPSFETGTVGTITSLKGWTLPSFSDTYYNISLGSSSACEGNKFGIPTPSDGNQYFFNRHGWNSSTGTTGTLSTTTSVALPNGIYFISADYKAYDKWDNNNKTYGSTLTLNAKQGDTELGSNTTKTFSNGSGVADFTSSDWSKLMTTVVISSEAKVTFNFVELLKGGVRSDVVLDNVRLYQFNNLADITDGTYYLYNEEAGVFLSTGCLHGTQAITDKYGLPITTAKQTDGTYIIRYADNTERNLGDNLYCDNSTTAYWVLSGDNTNGYVVFNQTAGFLKANGNHQALAATTEASEASKWELLTGAQHMAIINGYAASNKAAVLEAASISEETLNTYVVKDMTSSITNADFTSKNSGWTYTAVRTDNGSYNNGSYGSELYQIAGNFTQTVSGLQAGVYKVTAKGMYRDGTNDNCVTFENNGFYPSNMYISGNKYEARFKAWAEDNAGDANPNGADEFTTLANEGKYTTEFYTYVSDDGEGTGSLALKIDVPKWWKGGQRAIIGGVTLTYYSSDTSADADDYAALNAAIEAVKDYTIGFEDGEYAPYNNIAAIQALAAAKAIDQNVVNTQADVQAATDALTSATWTINEGEVNAVYDGSFNLTTEKSGDYIVPTGWTNLGYNTRVYNSSNMGSNTGVNACSQTACLFAKFTTTYGEVEGYTMPLKAGVYSLQFIYGGWNEVGTRDIKVYKVDDNSVTATVTPDNVKAKDNKAHTTTTSWSTYNGLVEVPSDGNYVLSYRSNTSSQNQICISDIVFKKATPGTLSVSAAKWATFIAPYACTLEDGVKAYTAAESGCTVEFTEVETTIPANTPVVVYKDVTETYTKTYYGLSTATEDTYTAGALVGVIKATNGIEAATGKTNYVLQNNAQGVGFYKVASGTISLKANRAYMSITSSAEAKAMISLPEDGDATAISYVGNADNAVNVGIYDLSGNRLSAPQKGINIINGVKVLVK